MSVFFCSVTGWGRGLWQELLSGWESIRQGSLQSGQLLKMQQHHYSVTPPPTHSASSVALYLISFCAELFLFGQPYVLFILYFYFGACHSKSAMFLIFFFLHFHTTFILLLFKECLKLYLVQFVNRTNVLHTINYRLNMFVSLLTFICAGMLIQFKCYRKSNVAPNTTFTFNCF